MRGALNAIPAGRSHQPETVLSMMKMTISHPSVLNGKIRFVFAVLTGLILIKMESVGLSAHSVELLTPIRASAKPATQGSDSLMDSALKCLQMRPMAALSTTPTTFASVVPPDSTWREEGATKLTISVLISIRTSISA